MNKKEQKNFEELKILLALRHHEKVDPDIAIPRREDGLVCGYNFNPYTKSVYKTCSTATSHGMSWNRTTSQQPMQQYSTKKLAYKALLHEMSIMFSRKMRDVELKMEADE